MLPAGKNPITIDFNPVVRSGSVHDAVKNQFLFFVHSFFGVVGRFWSFFVLNGLGINVLQVFSGVNVKTTH